MHEVEPARRRSVRHDVVLEHAEAGVRAEPTHIDVGGDHAVAADSRSEPRRHGWPAGADFPAPPARVQADGLEVTEGDRIEHVRERIEASRRLLALVVQEVVARHR